MFENVHSLTNTTPLSERLVTGLYRTPVDSHNIDSHNIDSHNIDSHNIDSHNIHCWKYNH